ncbi:MAG: hypothetical protein ACOCQD_04670, partial [archaeon]
MEKFMMPELIEEKEDGRKKIRGVALVDNYKSGNKWYYSKEFNDKLVEQANKAIESGDSLTIRSIHHPNDHVLQTVGKVTKLYKENDYQIEEGLTRDVVMYEGILSPTTAGKDVSILLEDKVINNVSIRAKSPIARPEVIEGDEVNYLLEANLRGIDFTDNPGVKYASAELA